MSAIIGVSGPAGVGKDTFANRLVDRHGFVSISLADEMKRICARVYRFTEEQLWGPSAERNRPDSRYPRGDGTCLSPRIALQILGTEFGRTCYQNTWVDVTLRDAKTVLDGHYGYSKAKGVEFLLWEKRYPSGVVVPDCRFQNEIDAIHQAGGKVVRLKRQTQTDALKVGVQNHASEAEQLTIPDGAFDMVIQVEDGLDNFYRQIDGLIGGLLS